MQTIGIASATISMEVTKEEVMLILNERAKKAQHALRDSYINEMKDLLARAKADGFTFGCKSKVWSVHNVEPWHDAAERWINLTA
jgi:hypothetical protein